MISHNNDLLFKLILKNNINSNIYDSKLSSIENIIYVYDDSIDNIIKNILFKYENVLNISILEKAIQKSSSILNYSNLNYIWLSLYLKRVIQNLSDEYIIEDDDIDILVFIFNKKYLNISNSLNISVPNWDLNKVKFYERLIFMNYTSFNLSYIDIRSEMNCLCNRLTFSEKNRKKLFFVSKKREFEEKAEGIDSSSKSSHIEKSDGDMSIDYKYNSQELIKNEYYKDNENTSKLSNMNKKRKSNTFSNNLIHKLNSNDIDEYPKLNKKQSMNSNRYNSNKSINSEIEKKEIILIIKRDATINNSQVDEIKNDISNNKDISIEDDNNSNDNSNNINEIVILDNKNVNEYVDETLSN